MTDLMTFTLAGFLFWPLTATAILWDDIHPRTGEQFIALGFAGLVGGGLLFVYCWIVVWYGVRWLLGRVR
jgi:hypothetical protein